MGGLDIIIAAISATANVGVILGTIGQLRRDKLRSKKGKEGLDQENGLRPQQTSSDPRRRKIIATLYLILLGLIFALGRLATIIGLSQSLQTSTFSFTFSPSAFRSLYAQYRLAGRFSYASNLFTIFMKVLLFTSIIAVRRQFLPAKASASKARLSLLGDALQILPLLGLGLATWSLALEINLHHQLNRAAQDVINGNNHIHGDVEFTADDIGLFTADLLKSKGVYTLAAFACWTVVITVAISATLLRKILHARRAGIVTNEQRTLVTFTKVILPALALEVALSAISVFLLIFQNDINLTAGVTVTGLVEIFSALFGDLACFGVAAWAMGRLAKEL